MITLPKFEYRSPRDVAEACSMLADGGGSARVLAGGTDVLIKLRSGSLKSTLLVGLKRIAGLGRITWDSSAGLSIGATALVANVEHHPVICKLFPAIAQAANQTATVQVRNAATVVGNICNASPCADNPPTLLALGAVCIVVGRAGERRVPLEALFVGPGRTSLSVDEVVTAVLVPAPQPGTGAGYHALSPGGPVGITSVSVAAMVRVHAGVCEQARIVLGAVGPTPLRAMRAEALLTGKALTDDVLAAAALAAPDDARPISDVRATADYRRRMVAVLARRALTEARARARQGSDR